MVAWLSKTLSSHRILWLLAFRRDEGGRSLAEWVTHVTGPGSSRMTLGSLAAGAVAAIAADTLNGRPDTALLHLPDRVHGNPFMLAELLRGLDDESLVEKRDSFVVLAGGTLPRRFVGSIEDHLNRLPHEAHTALQMASVLGRRFSLDELADMLYRSATDLLPVLRNAITAGLIVDESRRLSFRHDLVREAVQSMLPSSITTALRRRAVEVMVWPTLPLRAERHRDAKSVVHNVEAAAQSWPGFPFLRASALHARALLDQRTDLAVEAALLHEHDPRPLVRASALEDAGRLSGATDAPAAVAHLDRAFMLYLHADAHRDAARVRKQLRAHGVRRSAGREPRSAWPELTTSESR